MSDGTERLTPAAVSEMLRATGVALQAEIGTLPDKVASWHSAPGEWCVKEVLGHFIEAERRGFAGRVRVLLAENEPTLVGWDQAAVGRERNDCNRTIPVLLKEMSALRNDSVLLVARLREADLTRGGQHPHVGRLTVGDLIQEWLHHDREHVKQIHSTVQAYVWPHMGAAQKFSA